MASTAVSNICPLSLAVQGSGLSFSLLLHQHHQYHTRPSSVTAVFEAIEGESCSSLRPNGASFLPGPRLGQQLVSREGILALEMTLWDILQSRMCTSSSVGFSLLALSHQPA